MQTMMVQMGTGMIYGSIKFPLKLAPFYGVSHISASPLIPEWSIKEYLAQTPGGELKFTIFHYHANGEGNTS
jgi:hypothetical protein